MRSPRVVLPDRRILMAIAFVLATAILCPVVSACPVCFGETDAKTADGINSAIYLMVGVTGGVVGGIVAFFINFRRRAAALMGQIDRPPAVH